MKSFLLLAVSIVFLFDCCDMKKQQTARKTDTTESYILYIGTYTEKEAHVDGKAEGIYVYRMNAKTGALTYLSTSPFTINPSYLDVSHDGKFLYAVNETGGKTPDEKGQISAFRISDDHTGLGFINRVSSEGDYPCYIETDRSGKFVLAANYGSGNVALFPLEADGSLKPASSGHNHEGRGISSRQESAHAHCIMISDDGAFAYSNDLGTDKIYIYKISIDKLELSGIFETSAGSGPRHLAFHPAKNLLYSINELNGTIDCMLRDKVSGALSLVQTVSVVLEGDGAQSGSADIHITPSGEFLYASNRGNLNNIAAFRIDSDSGKLSLIGVQPVKGSSPRNFAIDPSGTFLLVANQNSDQIITFRIDTVTGRLAETGIVTNIPTPVCLKFLPVI